MTDYKLVPFEPTPEMVSAAEDAYMPFGDMEMAIRMALLAAPAVQGEPDVAALVEALELARRTLAMAALEGEVTRRIDSALAAHRKQGGEK